MSVSEKNIRIGTQTETVRRQFTGTPVLVDLSGTTARSAQLPVGDYYVRALIACYIKQGGSTVTATTSDFLLGAGDIAVMHVDDTTLRGYLAGITGGASQTAGLRIEPVEAI